MKPQIKAIYLTVKKMQRAIQFYEKIFQVNVSSENKRMSSFEFKNLTLLLYNPKIDNEKIKTDNNVIPNIEVKNLNETLSLIKKMNCKIIFSFLPKKN